MIQFSSSRALIDSRELSVQVDRGCSSGRKNVRRLLRVSSADFVFSMVNFDSIESPGLAQPQHICDAIQTLTLRLEPCGLLLSSRQIFRQFYFCPPDRQDLINKALSSLTCVWILRNSGLWENE